MTYHTPLHIGSVHCFRNGRSAGIRSLYAQVDERSRTIRIKCRPEDVECIGSILEHSTLFKGLLQKHCLEGFHVHLEIGKTDGVTCLWSTLLIPGSE